MVNKLWLINKGVVMDMWNYVPQEMRYVVYALLVFAGITIIGIVRLLNKKK